MARRIHVISALLLAMLSAGASAAAQTAARRPTLEVVLDDRAPSAAVELGAARTRARLMFEEAGIHLTFVTQTQSLAVVPGDVDRIHAVLLDQVSGASLIAADHRRLGFAVPPANRVYVHYDRVHALARSHGVGPGRFLGVVIAHELAHVLLPRAGHTHEGVMAAALSPAPKRPPAFTREHARLLRERFGLATVLAQK